MFVKCAGYQHQQYPRGMPHQGDMKGGAVGAQGAHPGIPTGPPPNGAPSPMPGFPQVGPMVTSSVAQMTMAQPGQPNPQRTALYNHQFYNPGGARPQQPYNTQVCSSGASQLLISCILSINF